MQRYFTYFLFIFLVFSFILPATLLAQNTPTIAPIKLDTWKGNSIILGSAFDITKHPDFAKFKVSIEYSEENAFTDQASGRPINFKSKDSIQKLDPMAPKGVDGTYGTFFFYLDNLTGEKYYYRLVIEWPESAEHPKGTKSYIVGQNPFSPQKGDVLETAQTIQDDFEKRSYRLLAPLPGLSVLLDPSLCEEQLKAGKISPNNPICNKADPSGFNGVINYMFELLIGVAAVLLVLRIMYEGYQYVVTDVPFIKGSAKSKLWEAVFGLLLALSAYLILNTINPKLVENEIGIEEVVVTLVTPEELGLDAPISTVPVGNLNDFWKNELNKMYLPSGAMCPKAGGSASIRKIAISFMGKVTYNNSGQGIMRTAGPSGTMYSDCSNFVNTVLACAGITPKTINHTSDMLAKGERITGAVEVLNGKGYVNGKELRPGDLVGVNVPNGHHHVWIYIGDGEILDSQVGGGKFTKPGPTGKSVNSIEKLKKTLYKDMHLNFVLRY